VDTAVLAFCTTGQAQALQWAVPVQVQALEIAPPP